MNLTLDRRAAGLGGVRDAAHRRAVPPVAFGRRDVLRLATAGIAASALPAAARPASGDDRPLAALLLPVTGPGADLARSLHHAAALAQPAAGKAALVVFDTGSTPDGARSAAAAAVRRNLPLIVGPLYGAQIAPAVAAADGVPVVALASDAAAAAGAFVLGITPAQAVAAILGYARSRGVRRVALDTGPSRWDAAAVAAAATAAHDLGLTVGDDRPEAVLVPGDADALTAAARRLAGSGVQLLGTHQGMALSGAGLAAIDGAWLAAPDPDGFGDFAARFESAFGNPPGVLAGLTYDAVRIAATLRAQGHLDRANVRDALTGSAGFPGVAGAVRFRGNGLATRELAILVATGSGFRTVAHSRPA